MSCTLPLPPLQQHRPSWPAFPTLPAIIPCSFHPWRAPGCAQEQAQLAEMAPELERSTSSARPSPDPTLGNISSVRSQQQLETDSLESHKEERPWQGEADAPSFSRACMSQLLGPQCLHLTDRGETSASPQAVPENLIFLLMIHLPPHCIKGIKWVS